MSDPRRKVLKEAVCLLVSETGFDSATEESVETLVEMMLSRKFTNFVYFLFSNIFILLVMTEFATTTRNYSELAGRTQPVVGDVVMAMVSMGMSFKEMEKYALRDGRPTARNLNVNKPQNPLQILQAGINKASNPVHIPNYLPQLPDPHAYVRTATYKQPETEYEAIREKSANQKRDIEKALTKFLAKTSETLNTITLDWSRLTLFCSTRHTQPLRRRRKSNVPT